MKRLKLKVAPPDDGSRLDKLLAKELLPKEPTLSRRKLKSVIDVGGVYVNGKRVRIASWAVRSGDEVRVEYSEDALVKAKEKSPVFKDGDVLLDQGGVIAVNKPPGLPSQATLDQSVRHVVPCLDEYFAEKGAKRRKLILIHRLDKETSGVLLLADDPKVATWLTDAFRERTVKKTYWAVIHGIPKETAFTERSPLSPIDKKTGDVRPLRAGGKSAVTHFKVLATQPDVNVALIECRPETGRSHQIRVHLDMNGYPIVGDKRYGRGLRRPLPPELAEAASEHQLLHAAAIQFQWPALESPTRLVAALPERFRRFLDLAGLAAPATP